MTGIALGLNNIPKIALGNTEILKVSLGTVDVWPNIPPVTEAVRLAFNTSINSTANTINIPSTWTVGDLVVSTQRAVTSASFGSMTGWTRVSEMSFGGAVQGVYFKILEASDLGATFTGVNGTQGRGIRALRFRALDALNNPVPIVAVAIGNLYETATDGNPTGRGFNALGNLSQLIGVYGGSQTPGMVRVMSQNSVEVWENDLQMNTAAGFVRNMMMNGGGVVTVDMNDSLAANILQGFTITAAYPPVNTVPPTITGSSVVGSTLTCDPGAWTNDPTLEYIWLANGVTIPFSFNPTFVTSAGQSGQTMTCRVTGVNAAGRVEALSNGIVVN